MDHLVVLTEVDREVAACLRLGVDRERFLEVVRPLVAEMLAGVNDEAQAAALLEAGLAHANARAAALPSRAPAREDDPIADLCGAARQALVTEPAVEEILAHWPTVIAHELARLLEDLAPREGGRVSPEAALFQLRDVCDTLVKLPTLVLARALIAFGTTEDGQVARDLLLREGLMGGRWIEAARTLAGQAAGTAAPGLATFTGLAEMMAAGGGLLEALGAFLRVRNDEIGHGARRSASVETAVILRQVLVGDLKVDDHPGFRAGHGVFAPGMKPLLAGLRAAVAARPWEGLVLEAGLPGAPLALMGAAAGQHWRAAVGHAVGHAAAGHAATPVDVFLRIGAGPERLALGPLVRGRLCRTCGHRDVFLYDNLYDGSRTGRFDLLDYARGHKNRVNGAEATDLGAWLREGPPPPAPAGLPDDGRLTSRAVVAMLDDARVDRRYLSPGYLRKGLADFLTAHASGVWWLQAPGHVGKSTFVQGLISPDLKDPLQDAVVAAFFFKREYRSGAATFLNGLGQAIQAALGVREDAAAVLPVVRDVLAAPRAERRGAFLAWLEAWRALRRRQFGDEARLVVVVDGLDEADAPGPDNGADAIAEAVARAEANREESALLFLPRAEELPAGLHLVLTSRRPGDGECPAWLAGAMAPVAATATRRIGLDDPDYRGLLLDYVRARWEGGQAPGAAERVLAAARVGPDAGEAGGALFTTVALVAEQLRRGEIAPEDLGNAAAPVAAQAAYLAGLGRLFGEKGADRAWQVLVALAAEEAAHDWQLGAGAVTDRATGNVLSPEGADWQGVEFAQLPRLLAMDRPDGGTDPRLVEILIALTSALAVSRAAAGTPRYRFGLRDFGQAIAAHPEGPGALALTHARAATLLLDAIETLSEPAPEAPSPTDQRARGEAEAMLRAGLFRLPGHVELAGLDPVRERLQGLAGRLINLIFRFGRAAQSRFHHDEAIAWWTLFARVTEGADLGDAWRQCPDLRKDLAMAYMNRGIAKASSTAHGAEAAIADFSEAIALEEALRAYLGDAWRPRPDLRHALAGAYMNRGIAKASSAAHGAEAAIADYQAAIDLKEALRADLGEAWRQRSDLRNDLAAAYMNRGNAKASSAAHGAEAAIADYQAAIDLKEALRADLGEAWRQRPDLRDGLAAAYMNRGNAKLGSAAHGAEAAIADYDIAIDLREPLRADLGEAWRQRPDLRNDLAAAYINRGNAKLGSAAHGAEAAIADYDIAIDLREPLRGDLGEAWRQSPGLRSDLAGAYMNRGTAKLGSAAHGAEAAIADYQAAIDLGEALRGDLGEAWRQRPDLRNDLATAYMNRGVAKRGSAAHEAGAAIADYDVAIDLREALRADLGEAWRQSPGLRNDFATAYINRGVAKQGSTAHGVGAAIADYDVAIDLGEALRADLGEAWRQSPEWVGGLQSAYLYRGRARRERGDLARAREDDASAAALQETSALG